jgi:hypothetical protein
MTREELIRMGAASGLSYYGMGKDRERFIAHMQRFADMAVARASLSSPGPDSAKVKLFNDRMALSEEALTAMKVMAAAEEREACARVCEEIERKATNQPPMVGQGCQACAYAIRARGQA